MRLIALIVTGLAMSGALSQTLPTYVPTNGLTGWYNLDNHALDSGPFLNHGTIHGSTGVEDRFGNVNGALRFDVNAWSWASGGHWVYIPFAEGYNAPQLSVSCWVQRNSGGLSWNGQPQAIAHRFQYGYNSPNGETWVFGMGNSISAEGCIGYAAVIQQSPSPAITLSTYTPEETPLLTWFHMVMTWDGENLLVYENGQLTSQASNPSFVINQVGNSGISLGMSTQANGHWAPLDGDLDEFGMWNRALSPEEIQMLYLGSNLVEGCSDESACNFDPEATSDDGSCIYPLIGDDCDAGSVACGEGQVWNSEAQTCVTISLFDSNFDGCVTNSDLIDFLTAYGLCLEAQCGDPVSYQGYDYQTVLIGDQCWFAENLRSANYDNGDAIPEGLSDGDWYSTTLGATAVYGEGSNTCFTYTPDGDACDGAWSLNEYGRLYNWYAVDDTRGLCPSGWHVPTDEEWMTMEMALGMSEAEANNTDWRGTDQGTQMKTTYGWVSDDNGTNSSGFSGLPGGYRDYNGSFLSAGDLGFWWSSSSNESNAWGRLLLHNFENVYRSDFGRTYGYFVRCLRDAE